ncbi:MAG: NAD-dependent epimerase/dehydratase family protein [Candidatus Poribacteria bacterium]|nr:NAD-dependent epimerase/dehydratase family protein [Candidatus Poribacteria bacterium]
MSKQSAPANILIIGGSGFVSGTLAHRAIDDGHKVWTITRGQRPIPGGIIALITDRHDSVAFQKAVADADVQWDVVIDCIGYEPADAKQDIEVFRSRARQLVFVSTDFVFDPAHRQFPQGEETDYYLSDGYGGKKRLCELELMNGDTGDMQWTVVRPCHIYGPGSELGCLPLHGRDPQLIAKLRAGETLQLVGGGHFLQQPILARDLADLILSIGGNEDTYGQIFCAAGPDIIESREYYRIIADILGVELNVEEISVSDHLAAHPEMASFLCHRIYDLDKLRSCGVRVPNTSIEQGLREHVESLLDRNG